MAHPLIASAKNLLVPSGVAARRIPIGLYAGLTFDIDLRSQSQLFLGLWEKETHPTIAAALPRVGWFVDVGSGKGELCALFAKRGRAKLIVAIEADPAEAETTKRSLRANGVGADRVRISNKFCGAARDDAHVRLDDLGMPLDEPGLIKIDVDGFELDVLESGRELLSRGKVELLVETHSTELERSCIEFLRGLGYDCRIIGHAWWRIFAPEHRPIPHNRWFVASRPAGAAARDQSICARA